MRVVVALVSVSKYGSNDQYIRSVFNNDFILLCNKYNDALDALIACHKSHPNKPALIISDTMLTYAEPSHIRKVVHDACKLLDKLDVVYLSRYLDDCRKTRTIDNATFTNYKFSRTYAPHGTDCILYNPNIVKYLIKHTFNDNWILDQIGNGTIKAGCVSPCLFVYDCSMVSHKSDYKKTVTCAPEQRFIQQVPGLDSSTLILMVAIMIIILVVAWALLKASPKCEHFSQDTSLPICDRSNQLMIGVTC